MSSVGIFLIGLIVVLAGLLTGYFILSLFRSKKTKKEDE